MYNSDGYQETLSKVKVIDFMELTTGWISIRQIRQEMRVVTKEGAAKLRTYLSRMCTTENGEHPFLERNDKQDGLYRRLELDRKPVDLTRKEATYWDLKWPFGLEDVVRIPTKGIIILAGEKDAGKTAFLSNFVALNMNKHVIDYWTSEIIGDDITERYYAIDPSLPDPLPFNAWERYANYADVIEPDHINVIDYLDTNSDYILVADEINKIFEKLDKGIAVIAMQKPLPSVTYIKGQKKVIQRDMAYGGTPTAKRACLYLSLSQGHIKIVFVKKRANPRIDPRNMQWTFNIDEKGANFLNIKQGALPEIDNQLI